METLQSSKIEVLQTLSKEGVLELLLWIKMHNKTTTTALISAFENRFDNLPSLLSELVDVEMIEMHKDSTPYSLTLRSTYIAEVIKDFKEYLMPSTAINV